MRVVCFANNRVGADCVSWLAQQERVEVVGVVVHPEAKARERAAILDGARAGGRHAPRVVEGDTLKREGTAAALSELRPDIGVSLYFAYVIPRAVIDLFPRGIVNLHPALLPYNRGGYPNIWTIVDQTPAGVTLHYVDEGLDTGDIIEQASVEVEAVDTGETLYRKLEKAAVELFRQAWPEIAAGRSPRTPQRHEIATAHRFRDVETIDALDLDAVRPVREVIDIIRARTFPPYKGAYFMDGGRRVYLRLELSYDEADEAARPVQSTQ